jgi:hypothetical protein
MPVFLYCLRPVYNPLARTRLSIIMLKDSYKLVKQEVKQYLNKQDNLYISFNESNNVINHRIVNIIITTKRGVFYNQNIDIKAIIIYIEFYAEKIKERAKVIAKG